MIIFIFLALVRFFCTKNLVKFYLTENEDKAGSERERETKGEREGGGRHNVLKKAGIEKKTFTKRNIFLPFFPKLILFRHPSCSYYRAALLR